MKIQSFFIFVLVFVFTSGLMACSGSSNEEKSGAEVESGMSNNCTLKSDGSMLCSGNGVHWQVGRKWKIKL